MLKQRRIPISTTALVLDSSTPSYSGVVATYTNTTTITLDSAVPATTDFQNGMHIHFHTGTGSGQTALITDDDGSRVMTLSPALSTALSTDTSYKIDPSLPPVGATVRVGGTTGGFNYSFRSGGTSATDYVAVPAGQYETFEPLTSTTLEVVSNDATDTLEITWE